MKLSHVDESQQPRMVDVGAKAVTHRTAQARARVTFPMHCTRQATSRRRVPFSP